MVFSCVFCGIIQLFANASILSTRNNNAYEIVGNYQLSIAMVSRAWIRDYPTKEEISYSASNDNWDTQPSIESHKRKHKEISDKHLNHVKDGLYEMIAS